MSTYHSKLSSEYQRLAKQFNLLTPQERSRLIMAAGARGDGAEQSRLVRAGSNNTVLLQDHVPFTLAFDEVAQAAYLDLLEEAHCYMDAFDRARRENADKEEDSAATDESAFIDLDRALANGYILRTTVEGWKRFCERWNVPPFALWEELPGYYRLKAALALAEKASFRPEGILAWLNRKAPPGAPELTSVPYTVEQIAAEYEGLFQRRLRCWIC